MLISEFQGGTAACRDSVLICEVQGELAPAVHDFLCRRPEFSPDTNWDVLFNYPWKRPEFPYGYALLDEQKQIQGFLGTIYQPRTIRGTSFLSCNLSCWIVDENYRAQLGKSGRGVGRRMLNSVLAQTDVIATALSPNDLSAKSFLSGGFKSLDTQQVIAPVIPGFRGFGATGKLEVSLDPHEFCARLKSQDQQICKDHVDLPCTHFLLEGSESGQYCYGIGTTAPIGRVAKLGELVFNLCYVSDPEFLARHSSALGGALWRQKRLAFVRYDKRLIPGRVSSLAREVECPRYYYASGVDVPGIDLAYTEFVLYNSY